MAQFVFSTLVAAVLISLFINGFAMIVGLGERKLIGRVHSRYGPTMVGKFGSLQTFADALKFFQKEPFVPAHAAKIIFVSVPVALVALAFLVLGFLPWGSFLFINSDYDVLAVTAFLALTPLLILAAAWASNNKYSSLGGFRAVSQILAYEAVLFLGLLPLFFQSASFRLADIVATQSSGLWFIITQPISFFLVIFAVIAVSERQPLDLPEAESELVQGWLTEYGGALFAIILLSQYIVLYIIAFVLAALFLGGWAWPLGWIGFAVKIALCAAIFMISRATYFRLRLDQLLDFSWKFLVPVGFANFFFTVLLPPFFL